MIKLSYDNLGFWRIFFGGGLLISHVFVIFVMVMMNFWLVYLFYLFIAGMQLFVKGAWRYLLIQDAYLSTDHQETVFKSLGGVDNRFNRMQIVKVSTNAGIADVPVDDGGQLKKFYFMVNSKENLKFLTGTTS